MAADGTTWTHSPGRRGIGSHQEATWGTDDWLTPPWLIAALGPFDLDPCAAPEPRPWPTAARHICRPDDGLTVPWEGRVWVNPPYSAVPRWLGRLSSHGHGTALVFARTETRWFTHVWRQASALLFLEGRLCFHRLNGRQQNGHNAGAPSVLIAYGTDDAERLRTSAVRGAFVSAWSCPDPPPPVGLF